MNDLSIFVNFGTLVLRIIVVIVRRYAINDIIFEKVIGNEHDTNCYLL